MGAVAAKSEAKVKVMVSLPESTAKFIRQLAAYEGRDVSEILVELIRTEFKDRVIPPVSLSA